MRVGAGALELRGALAPALGVALASALALVQMRAQVGVGASQSRAAEDGKVGSVRTMRLVDQIFGRTICWGWSWLFRSSGSRQRARTKWWRTRRF